MDEVAILKALIESDSVVGLLLAAVVLMVGFYIRHHMAKSSTTVKASGKGSSADWQAETEKRLAAIETTIQHMPTRDEVHAIDKSVIAIDAWVEGIQTTTQRTNHSVGRIESFLFALGDKE